MFRLSQLPRQEDDRVEFKGSRTPPKELGTKLACAVSGFANSGGGIFIAGIDSKTGDADGGLTVNEFCGRQPLAEWADQFICQVSPIPCFHIELVENPDGRGTIDPDKAVLVVLIDESSNGPHMAPDHRYYIRAGRHTVHARHSIVEAIWAKRHLSKPRITHHVRPRPDDDEVVQVGLVALTDAPAIDVELAMEPLPGIYGKECREFPVQIGVIDRNTPLFFDVSTREAIRRHSDEEFNLTVTYHDRNRSQPGKE